MDKRLHIVSFDVPVPPDYGGVIDIFYKLRALHALGIKIQLHCFEYGRKTSRELDGYCESVQYYKRRTGMHLLFGPLPYIVATRSAAGLLDNLKKDNDPILFEGLHCCFFLDHPALKGRRKIVRMHNIEHSYYACLAQAEKRFFRRNFFMSEARKLEKYETILGRADGIAAISPADTAALSVRYKGVENIMAFHPHDQVTGNGGSGGFALYHGSLSVGENNRAALYLVNEVFNGLQVPLVIAGNGASEELKTAVAHNRQVQLKENISTGEIYDLIRTAHINILPTFQSTGIKLKLLSALYCGRHCLVNLPMVKDTGLETLCSIADSPAEMKQLIPRLMQQPFDAGEKIAREKILLGKFSNLENARKLAGLIFNAARVNS